MSGLSTVTVFSTVTIARSNGARHSKFGDMKLAPSCNSSGSSSSGSSSIRTSSTSNNDNIRHLLACDGDLVKTFEPEVMRLPPLILILPRHCSDNFKLSLTPSILTFILQSTDGDNRTWGVPGHEHIHYPTDPRSTLTELGPVTSVQRRRVWQPVVDIVFIVVVVDNVILYGSALIELTRLTGTNRWTISLATGPDHKGDLIIFIAYGWHVSRYKSPNVFLRPEASLNSKQIHTDCIVLCPVPVANQSATNPTSSENIPIITTNSTATNNITKTTPAGSITSTITKITENPLPKRYSERTDITPTQFSYWTNTLDKCLSQPFPFQTATRRCCSLFRWPYSPRSFRCIVPFIFYVCCLLMLCTNAYRVETHVTPKHISGSPEPKRFGNAPDKTQLRARTPNYLFRLHDRHMRHWWDFDQFEADRLRHPVHRSRTSDMNIEKWNDASLGVITAVRHHQHIGTFQDHVLLEDPFVQPLLMHHPPESELHGHRLMFRLAEMPENEQLIAASLRLRYEPTTTRNSTTESDRFRAHCGHQKIDPHYWPITLWLHYDLNDQSIPWDLETVGSFEPDEPSCEWSLGMNNYTMLHLPPGWFHIPLSSTILNMLQQVNMHSNPTKYVTVRLRSLVPRIDRGQTLDKLRLHPRSANGFDMSQWLHEAPHLFTFHRDPQVLLKSSKRTRRSVPEQPTRSPELGRTTTKPKINSKSFHNKPVKEAIMDLRTRARRGASFEKRYRRLQRMLHSELRNSEHKHRPRRRASLPPQPRRNSRASSEDWREPSMTNDPYYYSDSRNAYRQPKDNFRGRGLSVGNTDTYESPSPSSADGFQDSRTAASVNGDDYLDSTCQRRDLIIDFDAVGWAGWVIAPQAYNARYCRGQCPFPLSTHYNTTNHAVLLQLVHLLDAARISGPCCVPNQLSSQSLLYHKQNGDVVLRVYQDMVVESCACR